MLHLKLIETFKRIEDTNLCAECQLVAQRWHIILQQVHQALEEWVVLALHVRVPGKTKEIHI